MIKQYIYYMNKEIMSKFTGLIMLVNMIRGRGGINNLKTFAI